MDPFDEARRALDAIEGGAVPAQLESSTLDFKQQITRSRNDALRDLAAAAICFANANGGVVVVGVADNVKGAGAFIGTDLVPDEVQQRIHELTTPSLLVDVQSHTRIQKRLLLIRVPRSPEVHADSKGRVYRRAGTSCYALGPQEVQRLREERYGFDWSAVVTHLTVDSVSPVALHAARQRLASLNDEERRKLSRLGDRDLLTALGVVDAEGRLLRAGELLFVDKPRLDFAVVRYQYRPTPAGEPQVVERFGAPLVLEYPRLLDYLQARRQTTPLTLPNGQQLEIADFPDLAVREALVNALIHRDYQLAHAVDVEHSPEVLAVTSPGPLVAGVTLDNLLTTPSRPRNPALARAIRILGFAEEIGRGIDRMFREMIKSGRELPRIEETLSHVRVSFLGGAPNKNIARFIAQLPEHERDDTDTMLVLFQLCSTRSVSAPKISRLLQKSVDETEVSLRRLASDQVGMLEPTRGTSRQRHPTYRLRAHVVRALGTALPYQRRTLDDIDKKVVAHVREYGRITNRTLQNLLDVKLTRARDLLADLVERGILVKTSTHQRGPGVEYGPGPKFPGQKKRRRRAMNAPPVQLTLDRFDDDRRDE